MQFKGVNRSPIRSHLNGFQFIAELGFRNSEYATSRKADISFRVGKHNVRRSPS